MSSQSANIRTWILTVIVLAIALIAGALIIRQAQSGTPAVAEAPPAQTTKPTQTLLIPGYGGGKTQLQNLSSKLSAAGITSEIVDVEDGEGDLNTYAAKTNAEAEEWRARGYNVDVVGFSNGGVIARIAASNQPENFNKVITLASPHNGTVWADLGNAIGQCPQACQQVRPRSDLLEELPDVADDDWLSIYSTSDEVINPAKSSVIPGASIAVIQDACKDKELRHGDVPTDPQTAALVIAFLGDKALPSSCQTGT
jgi:pimeloyl-ACP methyl ester carboxylesterase